jgi:3-hydroxyacyl-CoA dehydrogenase
MPASSSKVPFEIRRIGVVGAGTMGVGIACSALLAGFQVSLVDSTSTTLMAARVGIDGILKDAAARGKLELSQAQRVQEQNLESTVALEGIGDVDLVIEAVTEDLVVKRQVFATLDRICAPHCIFATNTSYLNLYDIRAGLDPRRPFLGLHFFAPAHAMKLLEVVVPDGCMPETLTVALQFAGRLGKRPVQAGPSEGFIGNRILQRCRMAADQMVLRGADPAQIDTALEGFGYALGPYAAADLSGLDIGWSFRKRRAERSGADPSAAQFPDALCRMGHLGRKSGCGYFCYDAAGRVSGLNPAVRPLILADRSRRGIAGQSFASADIVARYLAAMVNEGAAVLGEGVARCPSDVDLVLTAGYGFPKAEGGPMRWADRTGLDVLLTNIREWSAEGDPAFPSPAPLLEELVTSNRRFEHLNAGI